MVIPESGPPEQYPRIVPAPSQGARRGRFLWYLPWLVPLGWMAGFGWFLTDDAFVTFRYARNLLEGHGLVYNPGEYVEGYSTFLWVLELAALWGAFGLRPEHTAPWLSVICTVGTLAAMLWWVARLPGLSQRGLVGWMALGLVCSSATFAVWTPGWGLETRQFTFFIVLAVAGLTVYPERRRALLGVSLSLAAASLTRPEGPLFAACCFAWYAVQRRIATGRWRLDGRTAIALVGPCVILVTAHFLFRYAYYGEMLPNTYYAKYVRPYYENGFPYLGAAVVETGLYLLLPLAMLALGKGWRMRRDLTHALPLLCMIPHMMGIARMGGDIFENRPLDVYWPLLAVSAAAGIVHLSKWAFSAVGRRWSFRSVAFGWGGEGGGAYALLIFLLVLFYCSSIQAALLFETSKDHPGIHRPGKGHWVRLPQIQEDIRWLRAAPGMPALIDLHDGWRRYGRAAFYRYHAKKQLSKYRPYQNMRRGVFPPDAVAVVGAAGIPPYFLPDLRIIDVLGLTDATIARNPVRLPNRLRNLAHDRRPPHGYLAARGVNFAIHPAATSEGEALTRALYAVQVGSDLWLPFDAPSRDWVAARFKQFSYNREAPRRFEEMLKTARLLVRGPLDVYLDGRRLLYVKDGADRCAAVEDVIFLHVIPRETADLPPRHRQDGYENLDFNPPIVPSLTLPRDCGGMQGLPKYPIAALRTGQYSGKTGEQIWLEEIRFAEDDWDGG